MRMGACQTRREQCCQKRQADLACDRAAKPIVSPFEVSHKRKTPHSKRSAVRKNSADRRLIFSESLPWTREWNPIRTNWNDFSGQTLRMRTYSLSISRLFFFPPTLCRQFCDPRFSPTIWSNGRHGLIAFKIQNCSPMTSIKTTG